MEGGYHRYKTPGHDPMLGWVFGTVNILTSTITINNMRTFDVEKGEFISETNVGNAFMGAYHSLREDKHRLPAAVFRQFLHYKSDAFTKNGLPVPLIGVFSEQLAGNLYKSQYDLLCLAKDAQKIAKSAGISIIIDMVVTIFHGLFYDENTGLTRDEYEVRTRKILLISHMIASSSNIIYCVIMKNPKKLDIGGLLVTVVRLFSDIRFINKIKKEFIQTEIDKSLQIELDKLDLMLEANKSKA
jgi:hypothetical protein